MTNTAAVHQVTRRGLRALVAEGLLDGRCAEPILRKLEQALTECKQRLTLLVANCQHAWSEPVEDFIREEGYRIAGDPPGTMGVDRQLPMDVPPKVTP